jgi:hypothetical protein
MNAAKKKAGTQSTAKELRYCAIKPARPRVFAPEVSINRANIIMANSKFWANGTTLKYYFFTDKTMASDVGEKELALVRKAFKTWKDIGIGLDFEETAAQDEAQIRIAFVRGDGAWSYIGRDCLTIPKADPTMNFGWNLLTDPRTVGVAIHEIGHAIGFNHEHQSPFAGITWNEQAVLTYFKAPPNNWNEAGIRHNVLDKIDVSDTKGSKWDPDSIMEYDFPAALIKGPAPYNETGIKPPGDRLSKLDIEWTRKFYPTLKSDDFVALTETQSMTLSLESGQQGNFLFTPPVSRQYEIRMFGATDAVLLVYEDLGKKGKNYLVGKDDSGTDSNVYVKLRLDKGKRYLIQVRVLYQNPDSASAIMVW